jgi:serine/threonine-protein kinase RsbW
MVALYAVSKPSSTELVRTHETFCFEIEVRIPSEVQAISPLIDQLISLIEQSHSVAGEELAVEIALREAIGNAVVHGNRLDSAKLVEVHCRCDLATGVSMVVKDQGEGFDPDAIPDPLSAQNLEAEHGRGILLMRSQMDEVLFECGGSEVHMWKRARQQNQGRSWTEGAFFTSETYLRGDL